jgi:prolipoprotein diacylglyceryltransferase
LSKWKKLCTKKRTVAAYWIGLFCFVRFVRAEYFRDNHHQISELTLNKCWRVYRAAQCMIFASFSAVLAASFKIRIEGEK